MALNLHAIHIMKKLTLALIVFFAISTPAHAAGEVHIIEMVLPMYLLLMIPAILIEWYVMKRCLPTISLSKIFWPVTVANLVSTLVGTPITLAIIEMATAGGLIKLPNLSQIWNITVSIVKAPWQLYENGEALTLIFHLIPTLLSMIIFYFISVWIESLVLTKFFKISPNKKLINKICWKMNLVSYGVFFTFGLVALTFITRGFGML